jgi:hypothetical protein
MACPTRYREVTLMLDQTREDLIAELDQAWALALAQENPSAMIEASWKKCLLLGLVTDKIELRVIVDGNEISPGQAVEQAITRLVSTRRH